MNHLLSRLPLPGKLLIIALVPIGLILFLSFQLYHQKQENMLQDADYLERIHQSSIITRLIDQLQKERRYSFDYALEKKHRVEMLSERPLTDTLLQELEAHHDPSMNSFSTYAFLEPLDTTRSRIDKNNYEANLVMHYYSNAIYRLSTLNPFLFTRAGDLKGVSMDLALQKQLSEMITYLGLINANVYNVLYTRKYMVETLMGTLGTYDTYRSYEKQLLATADSQVVHQYKVILEHSAYTPVHEYLQKLFTTFHFDSTYTAEQWNTLSDQSLNQLRALQMMLLHKAENGISQYYIKEKSAQSRAVVFWIVCILLIIGLTIYILYLINRSLNQLKRAAQSIARGETNVSLAQATNDSIGSLTNSILNIQDSSRLLALQADRIGQGDFSTIIEPRGDDDVLVHAILHMKQRLQRFTEELEKSREDFRSLAEMVPQIVWTARADGFVDYYNEKWYETTGMKKGVDNRGWIQMIHPVDAGQVIHDWQEAVQTGSPFEIKLRIRIALNGNYKWFLSRALPIKDENGQLIKWFGTTTDINDQVMYHEKLEELVQQRTLELKRSNEDLQQFAHVASHDLKEPLRKIRTFSGRLLDEFGRQIPDKGKVYLEKVQRSSERMTGMIDSVLNYSTVNVSEQRLETIDLNLMFEGIESDLELFILQKEARISYHGLPHIKAAPALIYQLFYNLIYNALKFSKADEASCIEVSAREMEPEAVENFSELQPADSYIRIMIKDNGIGFNQDYAEKMFQIFTRLNSRDRYEGTGLGLALCRKIVHRHGGIIYAEGREGIGAAFIIILPKK